MGVPVLILGASGAGKTASLRNFKKGEIGVFNVANKLLPFKSDIVVVNTRDYRAITKGVVQCSAPSVAIDDSQYLMVFEEFDRAKETGYGKFTDMAQNFYSLVQAVIFNAPPEKIVYFLHHTEIDESGRVKAKTVGKMIDSKLTLEGLFSIVLLAGTDGQNHWFETQSDGYTTCKTPMGLFEEKRIDNDLKAVDSAIREFYNIGGRKDCYAKTE